MKEGLQPGTTHTARYEIDKDRTIGFMGEELRVYATPLMVRDMENTCRLFLEDLKHADAIDHTTGTRNSDD